MVRQILNYRTGDRRITRTWIRRIVLLTVLLIGIGTLTFGVRHGLSLYFSKARAIPRSWARDDIASILGRFSASVEVMEAARDWGNGDGESICFYMLRIKSGR